MTNGTENDHAVTTRRPTLTDPDHDANIRAADHRATALVAVASLAATLALAGVAIILDTGKWTSPAGMRVAFGILLVLAVGFFTAAAWFAVRGHGTGLEPTDASSSEDPMRALQRQSAAKHADVHTAMNLLFVGMVGVVLLTGLAVVADFIW
jgi:hypothetical protein